MDPGSREGIFYQWSETLSREEIDIEIFNVTHDHSLCANSPKSTRSLSSSGLIRRDKLNLFSRSEAVVGKKVIVDH